MELNRDPLEPQRIYARWLTWSTRVAFTLLVAFFAAYALGLAPAHVPIERLPELWGSSASQFLETSGVRPGLGWATFLPAGDMLVLAAIALIIGASVLCLIPVVGLFAARGERWLVAICVLQVAVLALAASGLLSAR